MRDGRLAGRRNAEPEIGDLRTPDRCFDGRPVFFEIALHERMVGFDHLMLGELPAHLHIGQIGFAYQHQAGCTHVKPGDNALPACGTIRGDMHAAIEQATQHGRTRPAYGCVRGHADRLVDHDHVVVLVHDRHIVGDGFRLLAFLDQVDLHDLPRLKRSGFGDLAIEHTHLTGVDQRGGLGP